MENQLHWVLDVVFGEDDSRVRAGHAGANLAMIRKVAVSLLRRAPGKGSLVTKRLKAGWDDDFLLSILQEFPLNIVRSPAITPWIAPATKAVNVLSASLLNIPHT
jgi:hypothetical protein